MQEIERILRELSKAVSLEGETLLNNQILIEEIDFLFAKEVMVGPLMLQLLS